MKISHCTTVLTDFKCIEFKNDKTEGFKFDFPDWIRALGENLKPFKT